MASLPTFRNHLLGSVVAVMALVVPGSAASINDIMVSDSTFLPEDLSANDLTLDQIISEKLGIDETTTGSVKKEPELLSYCLNIHDDAREARSAVLTERLKELQTNVDEKLIELEKRVAELRTWTERREQFLLRANDSLIKIFQTMRPDAAAQQLTEVGPAMAAAIISKLQPKYSSAIMTEMKPTDAAKIAMVLTNAIGKPGKEKQVVN